MKVKHTGPMGAQPKVTVHPGKVPAVKAAPVGSKRRSSKGRKK